MADSTDAIYSPDALTAMPARVSGPRARYPEELRTKGIEGLVLVETVLDVHGVPEPELTHTLSAPTNGIQFRDEALKVVLGSRFEPGRLDGRPVRVRPQIPVAWQIGGASLEQV
jgi:outer membrane biosynthesis protein TonB